MNKAPFFRAVLSLLALALLLAGAVPAVARPAPDNSPPAEVTDTAAQTQRDNGANATWHIETVDSELAGWWTSLALDSSDHPHIGYTSYNPSGWAIALKYAHYDGFAWQVETLDGPVNRKSLVLDSMDRPHISYHDCGMGWLKYAHFDGSSWQIEILDRHGGDPNSLALDLDGHPNIAYSSSGPPFYMMYASFDGTAWHTETVHYDYAPFSLAMDSSGQPHVSCAGPMGLEHAWYDGSAWQFEAVDNYVNSCASLALDSSDRPHVSYYRGYYGLGYAHYDGTGWVTETVDSAVDVGQYNSLALDSFGRPHISYYDWPNHLLKYAYYDGTAWQIETVDSGSVGQYASLALDSAGRPHISYCDGDNKSLKYAHKTSGDSAFRPDLHGYNFPNYGGHFPLPPIDFTADDVVRMFGADAACAAQWPVCVLKRPALLWEWNANRAMNGGHCDGFTTTGLRFFKDLDNPADFQTGASTAHDLLLENVRRHIAYYWVLQIPNPVATARSQALEKTPAEVLEQVRSTIAGGFADPTTLIVYNPARTAGHSITPYLVEDRGSGIHWIWIYDNNYPNDANRHVEVNVTANVWSYDLGGGIGTWSGDANSHSLGAIPISTYAQLAQCPWCGGAGAQSEPQLGQTWLSGEGHLLITDSQGRRIGYVGDQFVSEVPGAFGTVPPGGLGLPAEPIYYLPVTGTYTILLDGQILTQTATAAVTQFGPGYATSVQDVAVETGTQDLLAFAPDGTELAYRSSTDKETALILALDQVSESVQFEIGHADVGANQVVTLTADMSTGQLAFNNAQASGGEYDLEIWRVGAAGEQWFVHTGLVISATDTHYVDYGTWDGSGPMTLYVDHGSDGTIDETWVVGNQVRRIYLPLVVKDL